MFDFLFGKKPAPQVGPQTLENPIGLSSCICGRSRSYAECHELEFALPSGERPEPEY